MLIDCDVHQEIGDEVASIFPYLSKGWQEYVLSPTSHVGGGAPTPGSTISTAPAVMPYGVNPFGGLRKDAVPPSGLTAGSDPAFMAGELLDRFDIVGAILTSGDTGMGLGGWTNPYYARELSRAVNDQTVDVWLAADPRYYASVMLAPQVPDWAADEIRRLAGTPRVVQAMAVSNPHQYSFGHPLFDPIHRACAETGLPFAIHTFGEAFGAAPASPTAGGTPSLYGEFHSNSSQALMTHLSSFIVHGVFDRYPDFRLVLVEGGATWLPSFLRRFEADFKGIRREFPWCKKLPTEYVHDHVRISTQPLDVERADDPLIEALGQIGAEDVLVFASDYPHWDTDVPTKSQAVLPAAWRRKVGAENAAQLYGIELPVVA